ncbi:MAG: fibronectin type III domain-containing protein [Flavobacteriia bacterium]|nr:fibronectin type III domain-containing protein [Flavobacteriia bacterium]
MRKILLWCGAVLTMALSHDVSAQCTAVSTFPYTEDFDGATWIGTTTFDPCWDRVSTVDPDWTLDPNTTSSSNTGPSGDVTGGNYLYLETSSGSLGAEGYVNTPYFDMSSLTNPKLQFYYHKYGQTMGDLLVEASLDSGNTWCEIYRIVGETHFATTDPWTLDSVDLTLVKSSSTLLRFTGIRGSSFYGDMAIDSIAVYDGAASTGCTPPVCLSVDAVSATTMDVSWSGNASNYDVEYGTSGFTPGLGTTVSVSATSAQITGLSPNTSYDVYVRSNCGGGALSSFAGPLSALTPCVTLSSFPWVENFDSTNVWSPSTTYDACWSVTSAGSYRWQVNSGFTGSGSTGPSSDASGSGQYLYTEASSSGGDALAQLPDANLTSLTDPELKFSYHMYGADINRMYIEVSVDTGATWIAVDSLVGAQQSSETDAWALRVVDLDAYNTALTKIRFRGVRGASFGGDMAIDDVTLRNTPPCPDPTNFSSFNITSSSAEVTFVAAAGASRIVEWGPTGYTAGTGTVTTSANDTVNLTGLPAGTCIDVYIQSDCSGAGNGVSLQQGPFTICTAYVPDWLEDFNNGYPPNDFFEAVGTLGSALSYGSSSWVQDNFGNVSGASTCARMNIWSTGSPHQWMITPAIDLGTGNTYNLEYDVAWTEYAQTADAIIGVDDTVHVVISTDGGATFPRSNIITSYHQSNPIDAIGTHEVYQISGYNGIVHIGFYTRSTVSNEDTDFFIDNVEVRTPPACQEPFSFAPIQLFEDSVYFGFLADSSATSYNIEWGPCGYAQGTGMTSSLNSDTSGIGGLMPATCYDVYIQTDCGSSNSIWAGPFSFTTTCPAYFSAPYFEDFTMTSYGTADANNEWENCWSTDPNTITLRWESEDASGGNENSTGTGPFYDNTTPSTVGGGYMYLETSTSGAERSLLSPGIELSSLTTPTMEFYYHMYGATMSTLHVDVWNGSIWVDDVFTISGQQQTAGSDPWTQVQVPLAAFVGDTIQVRFRGERGTSFTGDMSIDDFSVVNGPSCSVVSGGFAENITSSAADLNWSAFTSSNYDIEWGPCGFTPGTGVGTVVTAVQPGYTLSGLSPNTCYEFYVTNNCDPNGTQYGPYSFLTACSAQLSGTYTIGGTPGPNNFSDLDTAIAELICGVSGPVTFQIMSNDTISSTLNIGSVSGVSATNTITFDGMNSAVLYAAGASPMWDLVDAQYITLKNMTMSDSLGSGVGVRLMGNSDNVTIEGNTIINGVSATSSATACIAVTGSTTSPSATGADVNNLVVRNNTLIGSYYGFTAYGGSSTSVKIDDITIEGNTVTDYYYYGIRVYYYNNVLVEENTVSNPRNTSNYGMYLYYNDNMDVIANYTIGSIYPMYIPGMNFSDPNGEANIINNMVINNGTSTTYSGVYVTGSSHDVNVYHNTILSAGYGWRDFSTTNYDFRNNIIVAEGNVAMDFSVAPDTGSTFDYNLYHRTSAGSLVEWPGAYADLAALQAAYPGENQNSLSGDPLFLSPTDLHLTGALANDVGDNSVGVNVDIDGDARPQTPSTTVDMGADEYTPLDWDAEAVMVYEPAGSGCGDSNVVVSVIVRNIGLNTITNMTVNATVSGTVSANLTTNYNGSLPSTAEDTIVVGTVNTYNGGNITVVGDVVLAMDGDSSNDTTGAVSASYISYEPMAMAADTVCEGSQIDLHAVSQTGVIHGWYANATDTVPVATGDTLSVTADANQTTYYLGYVTSGLDSIETTFAGGNSCGGGNMFDLTLNKQIVLEGVAMSTTTAAGSQFNVTVHYKMGSFSGSETNAADWTTHETGSVTSAGLGNASHFNFTTPLVLPAGAVALYVEFPASYTNGSFTYSNADMSITTGIGLCSSFGGTNNPRSFNGRLKYRASNSCSPNKVAVTYGIQALPTASFTGNPTYGIGDVAFDGSASTDADSLYWMFGDTAMGTASGTNPTYIYGGNGTYYVTMIAYNDCGADTISDSVTVAGINLTELAGVSDVRLFPNPSTGNVTLSLELVEAQEMLLEVVNLQGQVLYAEQLGRIDGEFIWSADLSEYPRGAYFVRLTGDKGVETLPLTLH